MKTVACLVHWLYTLTVSLSATAQVTTIDLSDTTAFAAKLDRLRQQYHIPSLSVGVVHGRKLVWHKGLGYADVANRIVPDEHTVYHLASVTKTFGALVLMQLVEAGKVSLDDPVTKYGINLGARWGNDPRIKVRHLLTHTAQGHSLNGFRPGYSFIYNGDMFGQLKQVIEQSSGQTFGQLLTRNILLPLRLQHTAPNLADTVDFALMGYDRAAFEKRVAKPYDWQNNQLVSVAYPTYFGPSAGLMSCVADLAIYATAIDDGLFLKPDTWKRMFTAAVSPKGKTLPYGLGWFMQHQKGVKLLWHTGLWTGNSSLLIKVPEKDLTFIILANSQHLNSPFYARFDFFRTNPKLQKDLRASAFAKAFLDQFVGKL
ncbi:serine hydrolase domain-containing protein [Fibrella forsythiae]|uniref:Beta-lactamase family protein n=1 Tax=Fibrella forsythiae TaxID=2817061 RepID=A0ABS3JPF7_9BACT|nr:serine hydrolase domain-containing protein [Fibrella forsythiae]MBO0951873.1 beta-lactamase family protein [Fibrella forsythiae]